MWYLGEWWNRARSHWTLIMCPDTQWRGSVHTAPRQTHEIGAASFTFNAAWIWVFLFLPVAYVNTKSSLAMSIRDSGKYRPIRKNVGLEPSVQAEAEASPEEELSRRTALRVLRGLGSKLLWTNSRTTGKDSSEFWSTCDLNADKRDRQWWPSSSGQKWETSPHSTTAGEERVGNFWGLWPLGGKVREHLALTRSYAELRQSSPFFPEVGGAERAAEHVYNWHHPSLFSFHSMTCAFTST